MKDIICKSAFYGDFSGVLFLEKFAFKFLNVFSITKNRYFFNAKNM